MRFLCKNIYAKTDEKKQWYGTLDVMNRTETGYEVEITGRGSSFYAIIGSYEYGNYICIPGWQVGCELASLKDIFWNQERLEQQVSSVDAITLATAIASIV